MGVIGTFCQLCAVAVQHDHYVPSGPSGRLKIFRGSEPDGGHTWEPDETPFRFGPEHGWLLSGVAVPYGPTGVVFHGTVEDGMFRDREGRPGPFVADGTEDAVALHERCWELLGRPPNAGAVPVSVGSHGWARVQPYQQQLFWFRELRDDGKGWMLADPRGDSEPSIRNAGRLRGLVAAARTTPPQTAPVTVGEVLARDGAWAGFTTAPDPNQSVRRYRADVTPELDRGGYPVFMQLVRRYDPEGRGRPTGPAMDECDAFEVALKAAIEADGAAILVCVLLGSGQAQYLLHARDETQTRARIEELCAQLGVTAGECESRRDADWATYFERFWPRRPHPG